jgi:hypothetical protein
VGAAYRPAATSDRFAFAVGLIAYAIDDRLFDAVSTFSNSPRLANTGRPLIRFLFDDALTSADPPAELGVVRGLSLSILWGR